MKTIRFDEGEFRRNFERILLNGAHADPSMLEWLTEDNIRHLGRAALSALNFAHREPDGDGGMARASEMLSAVE